MTSGTKHTPKQLFLEWYSRRGIKSKFLLTLIPIISVSLATVMIIGVVSTSRSVHTTLELTLTEAAELASKRITDQLEIYGQITVEIARWIAMFPEEDISVDDLDEVSERNSFINVSRIFENGSSIRGQNHTDKEYFTVPKADGDIYISDVFYAPEVDLNVILLSAPVVRGGKRDGVLTVMLDSAILSETVSDVTVGTDGGAYIINEDKVCVAHTKAEMIGQSISDLEALAEKDPRYSVIIGVWDKMLLGGSGYDTYEYLDGRRFTAYAPITGIQGWSVAITVLADEFTGSIRTSVTVMAVISLIFIIITLITVIMYINNLTARIAEATGRIELLSKGDLTTPVSEPKTPDEIGRLLIASSAMVKSLSGIINEIKYILNEMSGGNLNVRPAREYPGDLAEIRTSLENNIAAISSLILKISRASDEVARSSSQLASGAAGLSQGASEQASSIEELFSTISDIAQRAAEIAAPRTDRSSLDDDDFDDSLSADELSERKEKSAKTLMNKLIIAMERISENSAQINKITESVESISTETNILALNASVEAAHAGDAGKGFGVIASEIRQLAAKSKEAVYTAKNQTDRIMHSVERGGRMVGDTVDSVSSIVLALEQIKTALSQISNVIESAAATAEETAAASEELSAQADLLRETISQFKHSENI